MLSLFRNNNIFTIILLLLYAVPFLYSGFNHRLESVESTLLLKGLFQFTNDNKLFNFIFYLIIVFSSSLWVNNLINFYRLGKRQTYYTAVSFILLSFLIKDADLFSPVIISNLLLVGSIVQLYASYEKKTSVAEIFNAAMFISIAVLLNVQMVWFFPFLILSWLTLRTFNLTEFIILISAIILPFYLFGTYLFVIEKLNQWWFYEFLNSFGTTNFKFKLDIHFSLSLAALLLILLLSFIKFNALKSKTTIKEQKFINVLFILLICSSISFLGIKNIHTYDFLILAVPYSVFLSLILQSIKKNRLAESLHLILFLIAIIVQFNLLSYIKM